jgi:hypothetical protein
MTLIPLTDCCQHLGIDPKTLRAWLKTAHLAACLHPNDARVKCLTDTQLALLARLHERRLLDETVLAASPPAVPDPLRPEELTALRQQVAQLQSQVLTLQTHLTELTLTLLQRPAVPAAPTPRARATHAAPPVEAEAPLPPLPRGTVSATHPRSQALIQVREDGSCVIITPEQGVLPIAPDTPEWFDWLASLRSFRFQGLQGSYGATRKLKHGHPVAAFHIHFSRQGRSCNLYLSFFPAITLARLEAMAAAALARTAQP